MHIDDELEWSYVLENIIKKDSPLTQFKSINKNDIPTSLTKGNTEEKKKTRKWVTELLSENAPDLVLVDLRLYGKNEADTQVDKTSGAIVAQLIRDLSPGMPIILMTASNKAWVFEEIMKLGVDAYWMKEGIGDHLPPRGSLNNYIRLRELITTALGNEYQFLRYVVASINDIKKNQAIWWESQLWIDKVGCKPPKEVVHPLLNSIVLLVREYLHLYEMKYGYTFKGEEEWKRASLLNAVLMESRKVIETVHQLKGSEFAKQISNHGDPTGCQLFNDCSWIALHAKRTNRGESLTDFRKTRKIVLDLLSWLNKK
jgi:CheY-like chemotaxis protein